MVVKPIKRAGLITALGQALDARKASVSLTDSSARRDSMPPPAAQLNVLIAEVLILFYPGRRANVLLRLTYALPG